MMRGKNGYEFEDLKDFLRELEDSLKGWDKMIDRYGQFSQQAYEWEDRCFYVVSDGVEVGLVPKLIEINIDGSPHKVQSAVFVDETYWHVRKILESQGIFDW